MLRDSNWTTMYLVKKGFSLVKVTIAVVFAILIIGGGYLYFAKDDARVPSYIKTEQEESGNDLGENVVSVKQIQQTVQPEVNSPASATKETGSHMVSKTSNPTINYDTYV